MLLRQFPAQSRHSLNQGLHVPVPVTAGCRNGRLADDGLDGRLVNAEVIKQRDGRVAGIVQSHVGHFGLEQHGVPGGVVDRWIYGHSVEGE